MILKRPGLGTCSQNRVLSLAQAAEQSAASVPTTGSTRRAPVPLIPNHLQQALQLEEQGNYRQTCGGVAARSQRQRFNLVLQGLDIMVSEMVIAS